MRATAAPLRPFFTYYGGKWRIAPKYPAPVYDRIVEPFAGSAGYSLRYPDRDVILIERDEKVAATWRYLLSATPGEIRRLPLYGDGWTSTDDLDLPAGARYLIGFWLNKGMNAPCKTPSAWMRAGIQPNSQWGEAIRERIASQVDRIRHWRVFEDDYSAMPNIEATTWFIDPPYSTAAGRKYRHSQIDYSALAEWCRSRTGQVIVCDHPSATWLPFEHLVDAKATEGRQKSSARSAEGVWLGDWRWSRTDERA